MKLKNDLSLKCPSCQSDMSPIVLSCGNCHLEVRGEFKSNPFSRLDEDMLHFLHIFIHCEGKIADMEKALGLSYPTVKSKILRLKESLQSPIESHEEKELSTLQILAKIEKGEIDYINGLKLIKEAQEKKNAK